MLRLKYLQCMLRFEIGPREVGEKIGQTNRQTNRFSTITIENHQVRKLSFFISILISEKILFMKDTFQISEILNSL